MAGRIEACVDTSAFIAFVDRSAPTTPCFAGCSRSLRGSSRRHWSWPRGGAWFLRRYDRTRALQFLALIEDMEPFQIVPVGVAEQAGATRLLRRFSDQDLTLTDAVGLHLMQQRKLENCRSTDFHLGLTGVPLIVNQH